jgi:hypothetical protein
LQRKESIFTEKKCTALLNAVTGPAVHEEPIKDIGNVSYSLITDESTDVTTKKQLGVLVKQHSNKLFKILSTFGGIIIIPAADSLTFAIALFRFLDDNKLHRSGHRWLQHNVQQKQLRPDKTSRPQSVLGLN